MSVPVGDARAGADPWVEPRPAPEQRSRGRLALLLLVLAAIGVELGLLGAFLTASAPSLLGVKVPLGPVVGLLGDVAAGIWVVRTTRLRLALTAPALGWLGAVLPLSSSRPEGDLVITNSGRGLAFLLLGAVGWALAGVVARPAAPAPYEPPVPAMPPAAT